MKLYLLATKYFIQQKCEEIYDNILDFIDRFGFPAFLVFFLIYSIGACMLMDDPQVAPNLCIWLVIYPFHILLACALTFSICFILYLIFIALSCFIYWIKNNAKIAMQRAQKDLGIEQ